MSLYCLLPNMSKNFTLSEFCFHRMVWRIRESNP